MRAPATGAAVDSLRTWPRTTPGTGPWSGATMASRAKEIGESIGSRPGPAARAVRPFDQEPGVASVTVHYNPSRRARHDPVHRARRRLRDPDRPELKRSADP